MIKKLTILFLLLSATLFAKYLATQTCQECHEDIHREHVSSMHHKSSLFSDEVHKKVKDISSKDNYSCALCHMPSARNLRAVTKGTEQPDKNDVSHSDGVSCFYCHQISKVHKSKSFNINFSSATGEDKPTFFGNLTNPDQSNNHNAATNEIYKNSEVCMGCHSHKENDRGFEVCNTKDQNDATSDCIGCHMPRNSGGNEKFNKRGRSEYATHNFLGIHSSEMVKKSVELKLEYKKEMIELTITNKMGHSIITHPMRLKYVKTVVLRGGKTIWSNFGSSPLEDKEASFMLTLKDDNNNPSMPHTAVGYLMNQNLKAMSSKVVRYSVPKLQKGDEIKSTWISHVVNPKIAQKLEITTQNIVKPYVGVEKSIVLK